MRKIIFLILLLTQLSFAYNGTGNNEEITTVREILDYDTDAYHVKIKGQLVKQISHDIFLFDDGTGKIRVKVTQRMLQGLEIDPRTKVIIRGTINRLKYQTNIEGESVEIANY